MHYTTEQDPMNYTFLLLKHCAWWTVAAKHDGRGKSNDREFGSDAWFPQALSDALSNESDLVVA